MQCACACRKPLAPKFIVVEGIYANYGDIALLDKLVPLKEKYRWAHAVRTWMARWLVDSPHDASVHACDPAAH